METWNVSCSYHTTMMLRQVVILSFRQVEVTSCASEEHREKILSWWHLWHSLVGSPLTDTARKRLFLATLADCFQQLEMNPVHDDVL